MVSLKGEGMDMEDTVWFVVEDDSPPSTCPPHRPADADVCSGYGYFPAWAKPRPGT